MRQEICDFCPYAMFWGSTLAFSFSKTRNRFTAQLRCCFRTRARGHWLRVRFHQYGYFVGYNLPEEVYFPGFVQPLRIPYRGEGTHRVWRRCARLSDPRDWLLAVLQIWRERYPPEELAGPDP